MVEHRDMRLPEQCNGLKPSQALVLCRKLSLQGCLNLRERVVARWVEVVLGVMREVQVQPIDPAWQLKDTVVLSG